ncbi:hypothetical protein NLI96_g6798 [Meripilus lineatus]|uniref:Uncharacterized protein n=1 Tax=Meripilus lineatus TaxID=2056292 RepID=A0AAD5YFK9_9APHY|nr:hypothetical protein NLI96_g6798 [Physisporinus lineatus]
MQKWHYNVDKIIWSISWSRAHRGLLGVVGLGACAQASDVIIPSECVRDVKPTCTAAENARKRRLTFVDIRDWNEGHRDVCTGTALSDWTEPRAASDEDDLLTDTHESSDDGIDEESKSSDASESEVEEASDLNN